MKRPSRVGAALAGLLTLALGSAPAAAQEEPASDLLIRFGSVGSASLDAPLAGDRLTLPFARFGRTRGERPRELHRLTLRPLDLPAPSLAPAVTKTPARRIACADVSDR